jgi:hypothetical protein
MKPILLAALLTATTHAAVDQLRPGLHGSDKNVRCPIEVVPGKAIGPIQLGMPRAEVARLGMKVEQVRSLPQDEIVGRYSVAYDEQNRVRFVHLSLQDAPPCVRYKNQPIPKAIAAAKLAKIFPSCQKEEPGIGGNITRCEKIDIGDKGAWGGVTIRLHRPEAPAAYVPPAKLYQVIQRFGPKPHIQ